MILYLQLRILCKMPFYCSSSRVVVQSNWALLITCCSAIDLEHVYVAEMKKRMKNSLEAYVYSNNIWMYAFRAGFSTAWLTIFVGIVIFIDSTIFIELFKFWYRYWAYYDMHKITEISIYFRYIAHHYSRHQGHTHILHGALLVMETYTAK